jgi:pyridoxine 5-phosphate synthase
MKKLKLGVNIDHVATLRQQRRGIEPDPIKAALIAERCGADSIVCHLREDRRHIQDKDLYALRKKIQTRLNLEMAISYEIIEIALKVKPDQVTIVPERRQELTTEGGLDVIKNAKKLQKVIDKFHRNKIEVSLFVDPVIKQIRTAKDVGAKIIEIHTGRYAEARHKKQIKSEINAIAEASKIAKSEYKLFVAAGHGLDYQNVIEIARIPEIEELNIGYSIVSTAVFIGFENAVKKMREIIDKARAEILRR